MDGLKSHVIVAHDLGDVSDIAIDDTGGKVSSETSGDRSFISSGRTAVSGVDTTFAALYQS